MVRSMELTSHHQLKELGKVKRKGKTLVHMSCQPPRILLAGIHLGCVTRKDSEPEQLVRDNCETNSITIHPKTGSHVAEKFSWVLFLSPWMPLFPIKSLALSACMSPWTRVLDKSPFLGPGRAFKLSCSDNVILFSTKRNVLPSHETT